MTNNSNLHKAMNTKNDLRRKIKMIKIDIELLKRLSAIADAHDCLHEYRDVIKCLKNDNGLDDDIVHDFLDETNKLTDKIFEEEQEVDWLEIRRENDEWFGSFSDC